MDIVAIKERVHSLFEMDSVIHVCVHSSKPKIHINDTPVRIVGVYKNLFTIEAEENGLKKTFTIPYTDVFIGKVLIKELK